MQKPEIPVDEYERLQALKEYEILDTESQSEFDAITTLASTICETPIALITLIDFNRQWFLSRKGVNISETPRDFSFCAHVLNDEEPIFIIPDSRQDVRFYDNPMVLDDPSIRFYAGLPLEDDKGFALGTLCVIDKIPRQLNKAQLDSLQQLKQLAIGQLKLHKENLFTKRVSSESTERHLLKLELQKKEELYKLVSENASDLIAIHEPDGKYLFVSQSVENLLGYVPTEMIGSNPYQIMHPDDILNLQKGPHSRTLKGQRSENIEFRLRRVDGSYVWFEAYSVPILNELGEVTSFHSSSRDITERRKEKLELEKAKTEAEKANESQSNFLSMMSHEIRTPLNGIIGATKILIKKQRKDDNFEFVKILEQSSENLMTLVNDILDYNKIQRGNLNINNSKFDLFELSETIFNNYVLQGKEKGIKLNKKFDRNLGKQYTGDKIRISQILHNLISNAVKFTEKGSISFSIDIINSSHNNDLIRFVIKDSGIGIEDKDIDKIFETFTQATSFDSEHQRGSGLGLAITKELVALMNGEISVNSEFGVGSTFKVVLNLQKSKKSRKDKKKNIIPKGSSDTQILLVEDNEFNRIIAKDFIESWGFNVTEATNGKEAINELEKQKFDLVFLDIQMPIMDGFETIDYIRNTNNAYQNVPVVALTANVLGDIKEKAMQSGINELIHKPFDPSELYDQIIKFTEEKNDNNQHAKDQLLASIEKVFGDNPKLIQNHFALFKRVTLEGEQALKKAILDQDFKALKDYAHKYKSSFKLVGLDMLCQQAEILEEQVLKNQDSENVILLANEHLVDVNRLIKNLLIDE